MLAVVFLASLNESKSCDHGVEFYDCIFVTVQHYLLQLCFLARILPHEKDVVAWYVDADC